MAASNRDPAYLGRLLQLIEAGEIIALPGGEKPRRIEGEELRAMLSRFRKLGVLPSGKRGIEHRAFDGSGGLVKGKSDA
jgi:hypothetical protein